MEESAFSYEKYAAEIGKQVCLTPSTRRRKWRKHKMEHTFTPYASEQFKNVTNPASGYHYKAPDGTLWNLDSIESIGPGGPWAQLWTVNAWGSTHWRQACIAEFEREWKALDAPYHPF